MSILVVTDSVASIPADILGELGIDVVSLYINDGDTNQRELEMDIPAFYRRLTDMQSLPTSSTTRPAWSAARPPRRPSRGPWWDAP